MFGRVISVCVSLGLLLQSTLSFASLEHVRDDKGNFKIHVPSQWQSNRNLFGMPFSMLGPYQKGKRRPIVIIIPMGNAGQDMPKVSLKDNNHYRAGREKWLRKVGGKSLAFYPYSEEKIGAHTRGFSVGYRYFAGNTVFEEHTYYVTCKKKLYNFKTITTSTDRDSTKKTILESLRSFDCE
ncbi:MAG: hypothetical protein AB7F43_09875 [Bacteriovoracia bacterium]